MFIQLVRDTAGVDTGPCGPRDLPCNVYAPCTSYPQSLVLGLALRVPSKGVFALMAQKGPGCQRSSAPLLPSPHTESLPVYL